MSFSASATGQPERTRSLTLPGWLGAAFRRRRLLALQDIDPVIRQQRLTLALVTLAAKLVQADGAPSREELLAFRALFPQSDAAHEMSARLFAKASNCQRSPAANAREIAALFPRGDVSLEELMERLLRIATADAALSAAEMDFLKTVGRALGFSRGSLRTMIARHHMPASENPFHLLGVSAKASDDELRAAWRLKVRESHPDLMHGKGARAGHRAIAEARLAAVNAAYDGIQRQRMGKKAA